MTGITRRSEPLELHQHNFDNTQSSTKFFNKTSLHPHTQRCYHATNHILQKHETQTKAFPSSPRCPNPRCAAPLTGTLFSCLPGLAPSASNRVRHTVTHQDTMERGGKRLTEKEFWEKVLRAIALQEANGRMKKIARQRYPPFEPK